MLTLTRQPYKEKVDFERIAKSVKRFEKDGQIDEDSLVDDLPLLLKSSLTSRCQLWEDDRADLHGFGLMAVHRIDEYLQGSLYFYDLSGDRSLQLSAKILTWAETQLQDLARSWNLDATLKVKTRDDSAIRIAVLERQGFSHQGSFLTMAHPHPEAIAPVRLPEGFRVRPFDSRQEAREWVQLFADSFQDHSERYEVSVERLRHWHGDRHYRPELDLIVEAPNGELAAFCQGHLHRDNAPAIAPKTGWIRWLGTGRPFRKMGLGRALLSTTIARLHRTGAATVKLGVDACSLTGATRLYEALGFRRVETWMTYTKSV
ncbi:MAG: GNAT family N-acetyltransferase [Cyanobacteria bacterium J007]|jgi:mycothiol synthase|nr:MAG: GNAT family N-acetyltransferase [Cyanobacteria bacterium J007]